MNSKKYVFIFLTGLIYFAISMTQSACVGASSAVFDEIEKAVAPIEEVEKPVRHEETEQPEKQQPQEEETHESKEEQPATAEKEHIAPVKEQPVVEKEKKVIVKEEPVAEKITVKNPETKEVPAVQTPEENTVEPAPENIPNNEKQTKINLSSLKKIYDKCAVFLSELPDKIYFVKESMLDSIFPNRYDYPLCYKPLREIKKFSTPKEVLPYYFIFPEPVKKHLEDTAFKIRITDVAELFPYGFTIKYFGDKIEAPEKIVTPQGITDYRVLLNAPSPKIEVVGEPLYAKLVIDIRNNTLYKYDRDGFPLKAYLVATGARGSRTRPGLRVVSYTDTFPYRGAPNSKRAVDPYSYGPFIFFLNSVNMKTGKQYAVDQLLHGNGNEYSIGRKVSHGCVRMNNHVMRHEISKEVKRGDYILLINPD